MNRFFLTSLVLTIAQTGFSQSVLRCIIHDGIQRDYRIYVPTVYDGSAAVPLVFNLHGYTSNAFEQEVYGDFRPIADTANFILVHPDGTLDGTGTTFWNAFGSPSETVDDVGFISALIDSIDAEYNVDMNRVYTTGMSNGGFMSYKLSCDLSHRIAAMASVTGSMISTQIANCSPSHPVPVMEIHGTADPTVPYNGNPSLLMQPIADVLSYWVSFNNCNTTAVETAVPNIDLTDGCTADHFLYSVGDNGSTVEHYRINGGGHTWPGSNPLIAIGVTNRDFSASKEIWRFFSQYRLNQLVSVNEATTSEVPFTVYPNPSEGAFTLRLKDGRSTQVNVFDALGKLILTQSIAGGTAELNVPHAGVYFLRVESNGELFTQKLICN